VLRFVVIGETAALVVVDVIYFPQMRIWGKYITTATTKAAVSSVTGKIYNNSNN
jgi:hypothetical protein